MCLKTCIWNHRKNVISENCLECAHCDHFMSIGLHCRHTVCVNKSNIGIRKGHVRWLKQNVCSQFDCDHAIKCDYFPFPNFTCEHDPSNMTFLTIKDVQTQAFQMKMKNRNIDRNTVNLWDCWNNRVQSQYNWKG